MHQITFAYPSPTAANTISYGKECGKVLCALWIRNKLQIDIQRSLIILGKIITMMVIIIM